MTLLVKTYLCFLNLIYFTLFPCHNYNLLSCTAVKFVDHLAYLLFQRRSVGAGDVSSWQ